MEREKEKERENCEGWKDRKEIQAQRERGRTKLPSAILDVA